MADLVTNDEVNAYLGTNGVDYSADIKRASRRVEAKIGPVIYTSFTEKHDGGYDRFLLGYSPLVIGSVAITDNEIGQAVDPADFIEDEAGVVYKRAGIWGHGRNRFTVVYQAGRVPDAASVSEDIKEAVLILVKAARSGGATTVVRSRRIGSWQEEYDTQQGGSVLDEVNELLAPYMGVGI